MFWDSRSSQRVKCVYGKRNACIIRLEAPDIILPLFDRDTSSIASLMKLFFFYYYFVFFLYFIIYYYTAIGLSLSTRTNKTRCVTQTHFIDQRKWKVKVLCDVRSRVN